MQFRRNTIWLSLLMVITLACACAGKQEKPVASVEAAGEILEIQATPEPEFSKATPAPEIIEPSPTPEPEIKKAKIAAVGDLMVHTWQMNDAYNKETGEYDFSNDFEMIKKYLDEADLRIGNLETVFAGAEIGYSDFPMFNTPDSFGRAIKEAGFDLLTTANNHSMDKNVKGVVRTLDILDELGIEHVGTYRSAEERENYCIKEVQGIRLAFLSYTYGTNGLLVPEGMEYLVNLMDRNLIAQDLEKVKSLNPDLIIVMPHMGNEYELKPKQVFIDWIDFMIDNGADIVLASHPHVLQPMEVRRQIDADGTQREVFIAYSLGNFISSQRTEPRDAGIIVNIGLSKTDDQRAVVEKIELVPTWVQFKDQAGRDFVRVLGVADALFQYEQGIENELRPKDIARLERVHSEAMNIFFKGAADVPKMQEVYTFYEKLEDEPEE